MLPLIAAVLFISEFWLLNSAAQGLPTFEEFRAADRERRETGQRQTAESVRLMRIDPRRVARVVADDPNDAQMLWGAAELGGDWPLALSVNRTNAAVALRYACASAAKREYETALRWFRFCQNTDTNNLVPYLGELWILRQQSNTNETFRPPETASVYQDYAIPAARARIRVLEKAGYSPYSARRIGLMQNTYVEAMTQDLTREPTAQTAPFLLTVSHTMQHRPTLLLTEFVGLRLERVLLNGKLQPETDSEKRVEEIDDRRDDLQKLIATTERRTADFATEAEMVQYFDDVLSYGEEIAMKRLQLAVGS